MLPAQAQEVPAGIGIVVVEGEGAMTNMGQRVAHDPVVKVEDDSHRPVVNAAVSFTLPISGPSGEFSNGSKTLTVTTDKDGLAVAHGLKTNQSPGKLQIYVVASYRGLRARGLINQFIMAGPGSGSHGSAKVWIIIALVGAAAGGAVAATHGSGSSAATTPTTPVTPASIGITAGSGSISPPH